MKSNVNTTKPERKKLGPKGIAGAALIGTTIEWYDFFIYSISVPLILAPLFFPSDDSVTSMLAAFSTIGAAYLARPVGGLLFAHFGDRLGRKVTTLASLILMGVATTCVGLLPTFDSIGVAAPVLLIVLRLMQGAAVGGEWGGAVLLAVESAPPHKRAFYGAFPQYGSPLGMLLASSVLFVVQFLPDEQFTTWGWRIPFLISFLLVILGIGLRSRLEEPETFSKVKDSEKQKPVPLRTVLAEHRKAVVVTFGVFFVGMAGTLNFSFLPAYSKSEGFTSAQAGTVATLVASLISLPVMIFVARRADGRDRRHYIFIGGLLAAILIFPAFLLAQVAGDVGLVIGVTIVNAAVALPFVVLGSILPEQFPVEVRYTGMTLGNQMSALIGAGILPIMASLWVASVGGSFWPAALILVAAGLITALASRFLREPNIPAGRSDSAGEAEEKNAVVQHAPAAKGGRSSV
nr:MFS transporter [Rhodococcus sp. (in: high G+C Gram-positive bacteria)]